MIKERSMTWSIISRDAHDRRIGIAVATKFFAVGARVPTSRGEGRGLHPGLVNPLYGPHGLG